MQFGRLNRRDFDELMAHARERLQYAPGERHAYGAPDLAKGTVVNAMVWGLILIYQDKPSLVWIALVALGFQVFRGTGALMNML